MAIDRVVDSDQDEGEDSDKNDNVQKRFCSNQAKPHAQREDEHLLNLLNYEPMTHDPVVSSDPKTMVETMMN